MRGVRSDTLRHLGKLMAAVGTAAACGHEAAPSNTSVALPESPVADASTPPTASATATATATSTVQLQHMPQSDPVPPPSRNCVGVGPATQVSATLAQVGSDLYVELAVSIPKGTATFYPFPSQPPLSPSGGGPMIWGGKIIAWSYGANAITLRIKRDGSQQNGGIVASFALTCATGNGQLEIHAQFPQSTNGAKGTITSIRSD